MDSGFAVRVYGTDMPVLREKAEEVARPSRRSRA